MAQSFRLPDLGEGLQHAEIVKWHVSEGDHVVADQPLLSVETEKAVVEIPAPYRGHIKKLHVTEGDRVAVGDVLLDYAEGPAPDAGTVVGQVETDAEPRSDTPTTEAHRPRRATPVVRSLARKLNVSLDEVEPSGPGGTILSIDVELAAGRQPGAATPSGESVPLRGIRRTMAEKMTASRNAVTHATLTDTADLHRWSDSARVTLRAIRAVKGACIAEPSLNAWFDGETMTRTLHTDINLGVAVDTPDGLFVPVLRDVARAETHEIEQALDGLRQEIEKREIAPQDMWGQTITLSNYGAIAGEYAAMAIVPPQVAIVGVGRLRDQVVAFDGKIKIHPLLPLSVTFDHRAVTGGEAARFMAALLADLEKAE